MKARPHPHRRGLVIFALRPLHGALQKRHCRKSARVHGIEGDVLGGFAMKHALAAAAAALAFAMPQAQARSLAIYFSEPEESNAGQGVEPPPGPARFGATGRSRAATSTWRSSHPGTRGPISSTLRRWSSTQESMRRSRNSPRARPSATRAPSLGRCLFSKPTTRCS